MELSSSVATGSPELVRQAVNLELDRLVEEEITARTNSYGNGTGASRQLLTFGPADAFPIPSCGDDTRAVRVVPANVHARPGVGSATAAVPGVSARAAHVAHLQAATATATGPVPTRSPRPDGVSAAELLARNRRTNSAHEPVKLRLAVDSALSARPG